MLSSHKFILPISLCSGMLLFRAMGKNFPLTRHYYKLWSQIIAKICFGPNMIAITEVFAKSYLDMAKEQITPKR